MVSVNRRERVKIWVTSRGYVSLIKRIGAERVVVLGPTRRIASKPNLNRKVLFTRAIQYFIVEKESFLRGHKPKKNAFGT
jgi:hypothetical protein